MLCVGYIVTNAIMPEGSHVTPLFLTFSFTMFRMSHAGTEYRGVGVAATERAKSEWRKQSGAHCTSKGGSTTTYSSFFCYILCDYVGHFSMCVPIHACIIDRKYYVHLGCITICNDTNVCRIS